MYRIILNITRKCNYNCRYCWVIKDSKSVKDVALYKDFFIRNAWNISFIKFFWWEPLLEWDKLKEIITGIDYKNQFEIVTNWSLLDDEKLEFFNKYFNHLYFSVDTENETNYSLLENFRNKNSIVPKLSYNIIIIPWEEYKFLDKFNNLYSLWYREFNIMPVYFTMEWTKNQLLDLWAVMKKILDLSLIDKSLVLNWFMDNNWKKTALINKDLFLDVDGKVYYSDIMSTEFGDKYRKDLYLWDIKDLNLNDISEENFDAKDEIIRKFEWEINGIVKGQSELKKIMDYFSVYLTNKNKEQKWTD